ncbi:2OG-Fe(II) oxygenase [Bacteriovoracaceae bacterium]|nr:2OG-Fe(II) oxygenase [Bacteriovoracaceae bacterium]
MDLINLALEEKSWYLKENFLQDKLCNLISQTFLEPTNSNLLSKSKIGRGPREKENDLIRNGLICWIDDWEENLAIKQLNEVLCAMMHSLNSYFRLSLKRYESQFSFYSKGGFYCRHLDQHQQTRHRQISCCLYLNDCPKGGELIIYKKDSIVVVDKIIKPKKGSMVIFISGDIYHEVKLVSTPRYSISTWFRDDKINSSI